MVEPGDPDGLSEAPKTAAFDAASGDAARGPAAGASGTSLGIPSVKAGDRIGPYTLREQLGAGGFGVVWRALRTEPFNQEVAIKLLRTGLADPRDVARFEQERQTLALMDHPNIAKVLDGGVTPDGRTYVVMELVKGEPIHEFCDRNRLSIERRLQLFAQTCDAIQHAHMRGVIHRDIKPTNILACSVDDPALGGGIGMMVKVIDFGIAKGISPAAAAKEVFTRTGQLIGTPEYMSPEQAGGTNDLDTRADVYSLGVVLYELLSGAPPFDPRSLRSAGFAEIHRIIRDVEPAKPSARLTEMGKVEGDAKSADRIAQERGTTRVQLTQTLRREIEWVPMKAMRKDRGERYRSAMELADDVRNYLQGRALLAGPPSVSYRARKFVHRHRLAVGAAAAVAASLVVASVVSTLFGIAEARARRLAEQRERQVREIARFQGDMLADVDPEQAGLKLLQSLGERFDEAQRIGDVPEPLRSTESRQLRDFLRRVNATDAARAFLRQVVLSPASEAAGKGFADEPRVRTGLQQTLAETYLRLGLPREAVPLQEAALRTRQEAFGNEDRDTLASLAWSGLVKMSTDDWTESRRQLEQALDARRRLFGEGDPDTVASMQGLAKRLAERDDDRAGALTLYRTLTDPSGPAPAGVRRESSLGMAELLMREGRPQEARDLLLPLREAALADRDRDPHGAVLLLNNLGTAELRTGPSGLAEAEASFRKSLEIAEAALGQEHSLSFMVRDNLALLLETQQRLPEAEGLYRRGEEIGRRALPPNDASLLRTLNNHGQLVARQGKLDQAKALVGEAERGGILLRGREHPDSLDFMESMASVLEARGESAEAEKRRREVLQARRKALPAEDMLVLDSARELGRLLTDMGRFADAAGVLEPAVEDSMKRKPESGARWLVTLQLRDTLDAWRKAEPTGSAAARMPAVQARIEEMKRAREAVGLPADG